MKNKNYFVADEGDGLLNPFAMDMFDDDLYLEGHSGEDGYHLDDFNIVCWFSTWAEACRYCDIFGS